MAGVRPDTYEEHDRKVTRAAKRAHRARHDPARAHQLRPGRVWLCIGPNCWGKAFSPEQAEQNAREEYSGRDQQMPFIMMDAPPDVYVDGMGSTVYTPALYYQPEDFTEAQTEQPPTTAIGRETEKFQPIGDRPIEIYRWGTKEGN